MANQKTALYKVLVVVLVFLFWILSIGRVEAAEDERYKKLWYMDETYSNGLNRITYWSYYTPDESKLGKIIYSMNETIYYSAFYSFEPIELYTHNSKVRIDSSGNKTIEFDNDYNYNIGQSAATVTLNNGVTVYLYATTGWQKNNTSGSYSNNFSMYADFYTDLNVKDYDATTVIKYILNNGIEPTIPYYGDYSPDWSTSDYDQLLKIENFHASIVDDTLRMTWDPVDYPSGEREFHYIKFRFKQRHPGTQESGNRRAYVAKEYYIQYKELSGSLPISDMELTDGYILSSLQATPYYHLADNPEFPLKHGDTTYVYFDDDGNSSNPIIIDSAVDPDVNEEEVPRTILGAIQNFFSNFWRNITNTAKAAVVPEQDELLGLLGEMNDWFSERFGFIWYPFDLAIDIVAAFGLGEPNTKLTVPALTLNMMGGIQLWESFEIDLDPVDFLQYVRFFTSVLMCCGTVSLAIRKWEEWIGGKNQ